MKKIILGSITGIFLMLLAGTASAQLVQSPGDFAFFKEPASKNSSHVAKETRVSARVMRDFLKSYKNVSDEKWIELRDAFVALFNLDEIDYQVAYAKNGNWIRTIRSYQENNLPQDVRHMVKSTYYDYDINLVQEIEKPRDPLVYIIQLIGNTEIIKLIVCDGEITRLQKFRKSK
jgi:Putative beta-lactamase-inhibitor-like, PepSY-like